MTYVAGMPMFDGVVHGLLCDVVEVRGHGVVVDKDGRFALEAAGNPKQIFDLVAQTCSADIRPLRVRDDGSRPRANSRVL